MVKPDGCLRERRLARPRAAHAAAGLGLSALALVLAASAATRDSDRGRDPQAAPAGTGQEQEQEQEPGPRYIGFKECRKCHPEQAGAWGETKMSRAFELLAPGVRAERKAEIGLDPRRDYSRDTSCLPCHTTGWQEPGGYFVPPEGDTPEEVKARKQAADLQGVQCEMCHGPGSASAAHKKEVIEYQWRKVEELASLSGMLYPTEDTCRRCHMSDCPSIGEHYEFKFDERKENGTHFHFPLSFEHGCPHAHAPSKKKRGKAKSDSE